VFLSVFALPNFWDLILHQKEQRMLPAVVRIELMQEAVMVLAKSQ